MTRRGAVASEDSQWYFDALTAGRLELPRCEVCGHWARPTSASLCAECGSDAMTPVESSGKGRIVCTIVDHRAVEGERVLGLVELDEGPWIAGQILADPDGARPAQGTAVVLRIMAFDDGEPVPAFAVTRDD
ncbi:Zn-ribbon domain-containing OB-fold protein [Gordonia rhizosphera]|uniref:ChsH2 rubredoxin-like zinc ribbon domain-containing protein n=1 Tax=Gordonia rhizosphera NBRC 16068 TaxID=1108045 RepID=K6VVD9_9ACTN|nr:zinc ribbon domain-containing protein [Gordonia rhizosphera]GAB90830.1 hypothetical protein GORHZ_118_00460 [Gordonia rhizosphera NBRC 16068]